MEILSHMMMGTGSGVEFGQQRMSGQIRESSMDPAGRSPQFARAIEEAMETVDLPVPDKKQTINPRLQQFFIREIEMEPDTDEALAAGVLESLNQNMVVSILEGDKESATTPTIAVECANIEPETIELNTEIKPEQPVIDEKAGSTEIGTEIIADTANHSEAVSTYNAPAQTIPDSADLTNAALNVKDAAATQVNTQEAKAHDELTAQTGEVTARTPEIRTTDQQNSNELNYKQQEHGNLSPLENENDTEPVSAKEGKPTYSDVANTRNRSAEDTEQLQNNTPAPLAEGIRPERFRADQQMKQIAPDAPVKAENLFEEMISRVDSMKTDDQRTMTIQLKPEYLGKLALELISDAAGLHVRINAANGDVRTMINAQITALIQSLEEKGIAVVGVEVSHTGIDIGANNASREGQAKSGNSKNKNRHMDRTERISLGTMFPADLMGYYQDTGISSVEFSA
jgi:flagellar hook-length control protein FliK